MTENVYCSLCKKEVPIEQTDISYFGGFRYCVSHLNQTYIPEKEFNRLIDNFKKRIELKNNGKKM